MDSPRLSGYSRVRENDNRYLNRSHKEPFMNQRPNILLILNDDMGYSDIGCYGGEIDTPNLDALAERGLRFTQFYNTARCCPTRASILTGLHPHQADVGHMMRDDGVDGYLGDLNQDTATIAEVLKGAGYATYMSGKWHVTRHTPPDGSTHNWPLQRGFDRFYGIIHGASDFFYPPHLVDGNTPCSPPDDPDYYLTDDISDRCCDMLREHAQDGGDAPFFTYLAYTAPHWPLHAPEEDVAKYRGRFDRGWDRLREERLERLKASGILSDQWTLSERDEGVPPWEDEPEKEWQARRMEVYAAQVEIMDRGIGRVVDTLRDTGQLDNTLIIFLADNGGCAEELHGDLGNRCGRATVGTTTKDGLPVRHGNAPAILPGSPDTFCSYGLPWANVSNAPFRRYKHWVHEGGIATPFIVHWPAGIAAENGIRHQPYQLPDIMATFCDVAGATYPETRGGHRVQPCEGYSMASSFDDAEAPSARDVLTWEHEGNCALRRGKWKLVNRYPGSWELYDMETDRSETHDVADEHPDIVRVLADLYQAWADRCHVMPWDELKAVRSRK